MLLVSKKGPEAPLNNKIDQGLYLGTLDSPPLCLAVVSTDIRAKVSRVAFLPVAGIVYLEDNLQNLPFLADRKSHFFHFQWTSPHLFWARDSPTPLL